MIKKITIVIIILLIFGFFFFGKGYYSELFASLTFRKSIEDVGSGGFDNSLVLNYRNEPIIAYTTEDNKLIFKKLVNNVWQEKIITNDVFSGNKIDLAIDSKDNFYILYIAKDNSLNLAQNKKGVWQFEKVFDSASLSCNLVLDKNDVLHISFWSPKKGLVYGIKENNKWNIEIIDYGEVGFWNSLAIDRDQNPHISYFDFQNKSLLYLFFDGDQWKKEIVDSGGESASWSSIVLNKEDVPYISYFSEEDGGLKFAQKTKGGWIIENVDKGGIKGERTNIILDSQENPVISYAGLSDNTFRIAKKKENNWEVVIIYRNNEANEKSIRGDVGGENSIVIDSKDNIHLLWQDLFSGKIKYLKASF